MRPTFYPYPRFLLFLLLSFFLLTPSNLVFATTFKIPTSTSHPSGVLQRPNRSSPSSSSSSSSSYNNDMSSPRNVVPRDPGASTSVMRGGNSTPGSATSPAAAAAAAATDVETGPLLPSDPPEKYGSGGGAGAITSMGLKVLILLAVQNSSKNLLMRFVMKEKPQFLTSAAVIGSECTKLTLSILYIVLIERKPFSSIVQYMKQDWKNTLLVAVPGTAYNLQTSLEYVALANLDAAMFSVLVQTKLLFTATFAAIFLGKRLKYIQVISLVLLTVGVMLCNMKFGDEAGSYNMKGIMATLGIAVSSGFASVYTEKVIKTHRAKSPVTGQYGLAYTQVQLASMSLVTIGIYAIIMDFKPIVEYGLFHNFNGAAFLTILNSAIGGLIVASVLKYADSVLKGYATAISVIMTGVLSMFLFGTKLNVVYFMGIANVVVAVLLYNGKNLERLCCSN